jgi:CRISPR type IV-associated protein Csf2
MKIEVIIRNLTPIFSAAPGANTISADNTINPPGGGFPFSRSRTQSVIATDDSGSRRAVPVPVVPGNSMRNLLRRTMLKHILEPALYGRVQLSINAYAAAYAGSATGNPDGVASSFDELVTMRNHPFIGLFGGGPRMLEGRLMVDHLWPLHTDAQSVIGEGLEDRLVSGKITDVVWTRRVDPITAMTEEKDVALIKEGIAEANKWILERRLQSKAVAEKKRGNADKEKTSDTDAAGDTKAGRGLQAFNAHEVVVPGLEWFWRINVDQPNDAQVGLILAALSNLDKMRIAGGHSKNYGSLTIVDVTLDGQSVWAVDGLNLDSCESYMDALAEAMDAMGAGEFEQFAASAKDA